jgi:hypothetical protein
MKRRIGFNQATGHPLEKPLTAFLWANADWIVTHGAVVSWKTARKPWAEAVVLVTPAAFRTRVNERLIAAGFKTSLPHWDRHLDGHELVGEPPLTIHVFLPAPV